MDFRRLKQNPVLLMLILMLLIRGPVSALLKGGVYGIISWLRSTITTLPAKIIGLSFHEYAHARAAVMCGDDLPYYDGRVTLNPSAHVDPIGMLSLLFIGFGWGRPVRINPSRFNDPRRDSIIVGLAGVTMNFCIALCSGLVLKLLTVLLPFMYSSLLGRIIGSVLMEIIIVNISLMLFNLLPVPPLDGFGVITDIFNLRGSQFYTFVYYNSTLIFMMMILLDIPGMLLSGPLNAIFRFIVDNLCHLNNWWVFL